MKKIPKTIKIDAYTDDDGKPVCGECGQFEPCDCPYSIFVNLEWLPDNCPIWRKQGDAEWLGSAMATVEKEIPLSLSYAEDGRYAWPHRWAALYNRVAKQDDTGAEDEQL